MVVRAARRTSCKTYLSSCCRLHQTSNVLVGAVMAGVGAGTAATPRTAMIATMKRVLANMVYKLWLSRPLQRQLLSTFSTVRYPSMPPHEYSPPRII